MYIWTPSSYLQFFLLGGGGGECLFLLNIHFTSVMHIHFTSTQSNIKKKENLETLDTQVKPMAD